MGDRLVELLVLILGDLGLRPPPKGGCTVDLLFGRSGALLVPLVVVLLLRVVQVDREGNVVGVLLDRLLDLPTIGELFPVLGEEERDGGPVGLSLGRLNIEAGAAVGGPLMRLTLTGLFRDHLKLIGDHEGAVEADAELTNEVGVLLIVTGQLR